MAISDSKLSKKRLGDWVINPYVGCEHGCKHCYCPAMPGVKFFNLGHTQQEWGMYLFPKAGFIEALRKDVKKHPRSGSVAGQGYVLASFLTDCYTPAEAVHKLTRQSLEILLDAGCKVRIQTRSALVERDFDLLTMYKNQVLLGTSLPYLDDQLARVLEPKASAPTRRLEMLRRARDAGLNVYVAIAPFMPFHGENELNAVVNAIAGLNPIEIFDEVLNPRSENLEMMNAALANANRSERVPVEYLPQWPHWTFEHLKAAQAACERAGVGQKFIAWPDPRATIAKSLQEDERAWLQAWLPSEDDIKVPPRTRSRRFNREIS